MKTFIAATMILASTVAAGAETWSTDVCPNGGEANDGTVTLETVDGSAVMLTPMIEVTGWEWGCYMYRTGVNDAGATTYVAECSSEGEEFVNDAQMMNTKDNTLILRMDDYDIRLYACK